MPNNLCELMLMNLNIIEYVFRETSKYTERKKILAKSTLFNFKKKMKKTFDSYKFRSLQSLLCFA